MASVYRPSGHSSVTGIGKTAAGGDKRSPAFHDAFARIAAKRVPNRDFSLVELPSKPIAEEKTYACQKCKDRGFLRVDLPAGHPDLGKVKPVPCECKLQERKEKRKRELREWSGIERLRDYHRYTFETFNADLRGTSSALKAAKTFLADFDGFLVFLGPTGVGKTHLSIAILREYADTRDGMYYYSTVPNLLDKLKETFGPNSDESFQSRFKAISECDLLILDDFGAHSSSPWAYEKMYQMIDNRLMYGLPTIISSNSHRLLPKGVTPTWEAPANEINIDSRLRSRLSDQSIVTTVVLDKASDYRPTKRKQ